MPNLPPEVHWMILEQLYLPELENAALTNKEFRSMSLKRLSEYRQLSREFSSLDWTTFITAERPFYQLTLKMLALLRSSDARYYLKSIRLPYLHGCARRYWHDLNVDFLREGFEKFLWSWGPEVNPRTASIGPWSQVWAHALHLVILQSPNLETLSNNCTGDLNRELAFRLGISTKRCYQPELCPRPGISKNIVPPLQLFKTIHYEHGEFLNYEDGGNKLFPLISLPSIETVTIRWPSVGFSIPCRALQPQSPATQVYITGDRPTREMARRLAKSFRGPCTIHAPDFNDVIFSTANENEEYNWKTLHIPNAGAGLRRWKLENDWESRRRG